LVGTEREPPLGNKTGLFWLTAFVYGLAKSVGFL